LTCTLGILVLFISSATTGSSDAGGILTDILVLRAGMPHDDSWWRCLQHVPSLSEHVPLVRHGDRCLVLRCGCGQLRVTDLLSLIRGGQATPYLVRRVACWWTAWLA